MEDSKYVYWVVTDRRLTKCFDSLEEAILFYDKFESAYIYMQEHGNIMSSDMVVRRKGNMDDVNIPKCHMESYLNCKFS